MLSYIYYSVIFIFSFLVTYVLTYFAIPRLKRFGMTGKDVNKPNMPAVAEMGGLTVVAGFSAGLLVAFFLNIFYGFSFNLIHIMAGLITIHIVAFIGIVDDLLNIPQWFKAFLPLFAAVPLVVVKAVGSTVVSVPFFGSFDFGLVYIIIFIPVGIAVASNLTNMLAGFNGMEAGMGAVMFAALAILAIIHHSPIMLILSLAMSGALLAFLAYNKYPSRIFPGDVGNLTIGAALGSAVIIGNLETAAVILLFPHIVDFFIKLKNWFPSRDWWGIYKNGKLYPVGGTVRGLAQLVMKRSNGISEQELIRFFILIEALAGALAILLFIKF